MKLNTTSISENATSNSSKPATLIFGKYSVSGIDSRVRSFGFALATIAILSLTTYGLLGTRKMV
jgi:hypothetical protein